MALASNAKKPGEPSAKIMPKSMEIRILGFVNTETDSAIPSQKILYTKCVDFEMMITPKTTIRDIKDFTMARLTTLRYYNIQLEFLNINLKDAIRMGAIIKKFPLFMTVKCLHLHIIWPDDMFKMMYKTFRDMGMNEEKALEGTKSFMDTYQNKEIDHEYEIAMRLEKCRIRLEKHGIKITNPQNPPLTPCE